MPEKLDPCPLCGAKCVFIEKASGPFYERMVPCKKCEYHADIATHRALCAMKRELEAKLKAKQGKVFYVMPCNVQKSSKPLCLRCAKRARCTLTAIPVRAIVAEGRKTHVK